MEKKPVTRVEVQFAEMGRGCLRDLEAQFESAGYSGLREQAIAVLTDIITRYYEEKQKAAK